MQDPNTPQYPPGYPQQYPPGYQQQYPPNAYPGQPWPGAPPQPPQPKKMSLIKKIGLGVAAMFWGTCALGLVASHNDTRTNATSTASFATTTSPGSSEAESQLPWLSTVRQNCSAYDAAANQIQKSRIFRETEALVRDLPVPTMRGTLRSLSTNQGGSNLTIRVNVGAVEFSTPSFTAPITQGSQVYTQAENLKEGQCVMFSGTISKPSSMLERSQVCDPEYFFQFSSIGPCM